MGFFNGFTTGRAMLKAFAVLLALAPALWVAWKMLTLHQ